MCFPSKNHRLEIIDEIKRMDSKQTGRIDFDIYAQKAFEGFYDLDLLESNNTNDYKELKNLYQVEKKKWHFIANKNSALLDYDQFYSFVYSEEFPDIQEYETGVFFDIYDSNQDNLLDVNEFISEIKSKLIF